MVVRVSVGILGTLVAVDADTQVRVGNGAHRVVLNVLAAAAGRDITIDELVEALQEHAPERTWSRRNVYSAVTRVKQRLPDAVVSAIPGSYRIDLSVCDVDAQQFSQLADDGARRMETGDASGAVESLRAALALWRGGALADVRGVGIVDAVATRLNELRIGATEDLAFALIRAGRPAEAVALLEDLLGVHPLREHAWALLLRALDGAGRTDQVWAAFDRARLALSEAGLEPGLELSDAVNRLEVGPVPAPTRSPGTASRPNDAFVRIAAEQPMVARHDEIADIEATMARVAAGDGGRLLVLEGEPGIGKTRLAAEIGARAETSGYTVWFEVCPPRLRVPFGPLLNWVRRMLAGVDPASRRRLVDGPLGRLTATADSLNEADPTRDRWLMYEAIADLAASESAGGAVLVLDDLHRSDPDTLDLLHHVLSTRADAALLVVATMSDHRRNEQPEPLWHLPATRRMRIEGLDLDSGVTLAFRLAGEPSLDRSGGARLLRLTNGNPLFISAVVGDRAMLESVAHGDLPRPRAAGMQVAQAVARHVALLDAETQTALEIGSVLGSMFDTKTLVASAVAAGEQSPAALLDGVRTAVAHGLLLVDPDTPGRHVFAHGLVRSSVYGDLPAERRAALHLAAGRAIEQVDRAADVGDLAHHFGRAIPACSAATAICYIRLAGEHAARVLSFERADDYFTLAADLWTHAPTELTDAERGEMWLLAGRARTDAGRLDEAQEAFLTAAEVAVDEQHAELLVLAALGYGETLGMRRPTERGAVLMRRAVEAVDVDPVLRADAIGTLHNVDASAALVVSEAALEQSRDDGPERRGVLLEQLCWHRLGEQRRSLAGQLGALGDASDDDLMRGLGALHSWVAEIQLGHSRFDDPRGSEVEALVERTSSDELWWQWKVWTATVAFNLGQLDVAAEGMDAARRVKFPAPETARCFQTRATRLELVYASQRAMYDALVGEQAIQRDVLSTTRLSPTIRAYYRRPFDALGLARTGRVDDAAAACRELLDEGLLCGPATADWLVNAMLLGDTFAALGDPVGSEQVLEVLRPFADLHVVLGLAQFHGSVRHHLGLLLGAMGCHDAAADELRAAVEANEHVGTWMFSTCSRFQLARQLQLCAGHGNSAEADRLLGVALTDAKEMGIQLGWQPLPRPQ